MLPLVALMVWMGTYTRTFLPPVSAANARVLQQTQVNVRFQVERAPAPDASGTEVAVVR